MLSISEKVGNLLGFNKSPSIDTDLLLGRVKYASLMNVLVNSSGYEGLKILLSKRASYIKSQIKPNNQDRYNELSFRLDEIEGIIKSIETIIKEGNESSELLEEMNNKTSRQAEPSLKTL